MTSAAWESLEEPENTFEMVQEINAGAPTIKVVGVGGGGSNAVSRMYKEKLPVVEYYSINNRCPAPFPAGRSPPHGHRQQPDPRAGRWRQP